jgi:tryptophan-rich sensory protein
MAPLGAVEGVHLSGAIGIDVVLFWRTDRLAGWLLMSYALSAF